MFLSTYWCSLCAASAHLAQSLTGGSFVADPLRTMRIVVQLAQQQRNCMLGALSSSYRGCGKCAGSSCPPTALVVCDNPGMHTMPVFNSRG